MGDDGEGEAMKCPTCKQTIRTPRQKKQTGFSMAAYLVEHGLEPITGPVHDWSHPIMKRTLVPPTMDKDGRAIGMARIEKVYERNSEWASMRYGHSPFDKSKEQVARESNVGTLEEFQKQAAAQVDKDITPC